MPLSLEDKESYIILSKDDINFLSLKAFYVKAMNFGFVNVSLCWLIGHVCYMNYDMSLTLGKKILIGFNKSNGDEVRPYLEIIECYFSLKDSFTDLRIEWIFGLPILKYNR